MKSSLRKINGRLSAYYTYVFAFDCVFGYAVYTGYFALQGLSPAAIGGLLAFWVAAAMALEVPSGALADRCDRRVLLIAAPVIKMGCFAAWALAPPGVVWPYALGFVFWAAGSALASGTKEALLYEHLSAVRATRWYEALLGREAAWKTAGITVGCAAGGFIGAVDMPLAFWASLPALAVAAGAAVFLPDIRWARGAGHTDLAWAQHIRGAFQAFGESADLRFIVLYLALGADLLGCLEEFEQLFYMAVGLPVWAWGLAIGAIGLLHIAGSVYAHRIGAHRAAFWALPALAGLAVLAAGSVGPTPWALAPLILAYGAIAPTEVLANARLQRTFTGASRATATSTMSLCRGVVAVVFMVGFGLMADAAGVLAAYQAAGAALLLFALWVLWCGPRQTAIPCRRRS